MALKAPIAPDNCPSGGCFGGGGSCTLAKSIAVDQSFYKGIHCTGLQGLIYKVERVAQILDGDPNQKHLDSILLVGVCHVIAVFAQAFACVLY